MKAVEFGNYIRNLRKQRKMTIRQLELYSGVSNGYLSQIETGKRAIPTPNILKKLADPLNIDYETLMRKAGYIDEHGNLTTDDNLTETDLEKVLQGYDLKWGSRRLSKEESERAKEILTILLANKKDT